MGIVDWVKERGRDEVDVDVDVDIDAPEVRISRREIGMSIWLVRTL